MTSPHSNDPINDPPPPYPSRQRRTRTTRSSNRRLNSQHIQLSSAESDYDALSSPQPFPTTEDSFNLEGGADQTETTSLLPRSAGPPRTTRPRTISYTSTNSAAPSLAQTLVSLFQPEPDAELDRESTGVTEESPLLLYQEPNDDGTDRLHCLPGFERQRRRLSWSSLIIWKRYFRPMTRMVYYKSLFHLLVLNFPFALAAWVYLFVFTLVRLFLFHSLRVRRTCILTDVYSSALGA
jgi:hypothetical protein